MGNEDLGTKNNHSLNETVSCGSSSNESEMSTDNDKESDLEIKTNTQNENVSDIEDGQGNQENYNLQQKSYQRVMESLLDQIKNIITENSTNKKDLMKVEKLMEKNRSVVKLTDENTMYELSRNISINHENFLRMETFKSEKKKLWEMKWCSQTYIISAFTLGYNHHCQS